MIAAAVDLPLIVYNIPGRTGSNIAPETFARLCEIRNIVGIKEASGSMDQISDILRLCGDRLTILSGDDSLTLPIMALGGKGVIATISNVMPREMHELAAAALAGDFARAREIHYKMMPLMRALFIETNPIPVKQALRLHGQVQERDADAAGADDVRAGGEAARRDERNAPDLTSWSS